MAIFQLAKMNTLTLIWVGFLGVRFEVCVARGGVVSKTRYKLQIWYVSRHTYVVSENLSFSTKALLILLMSEKMTMKSQSAYMRSLS